MVNYSEIFHTYLELNKFFRMNLYNTTTLHKWIAKLDYDKYFNDYDNFFVFLEYIYKKNYVIPFFIVKFTASNKKLSTLNLQDNTYNYIISNSWNNLKKDKFIHFIDQDIEEEFNYKNKKYYRLKDSIENEICYYYYHPIQIIQILTLIYSLFKNKIKLLSIKDFNEHYQKRWSEIEFEVVLQSRVLSFALKKGLMTKEDIISRIESEISETEELPFRRYNWLSPKFFHLWIKLESIYLPKYFSPYQPPSYSIYDINIPKTELKKILKKEDKFRAVLFEERLDIIDSEEMKMLQGIKWSMKRVYHDFYGLDNWADIILEMGQSKKNSLKGNMSYFINIFQIMRILELANWELKTEDEKAKIKKPIFICDENEYPDYRLRLLIDYDLLAEKIIIIYVEGDTEYNILNDWLTEFRYRGHFDKIEIQNIEGKTKTSNTFSYIIKNFKRKSHFLFLDADNRSKKDEKLNKLIKLSIPRDSVYFSIPDFVSANFKIDEILKAYRNYARAGKIEITYEFLHNLKKNLVEAENNTKSFEKTIEKIEYEFRNKISFPPFSKTSFSKFLSKILIRNCKKGDIPEFEKVLEVFFTRIQSFITEYYERKYSVR